MTFQCVQLSQPEPKRYINNTKSVTFIFSFQVLKKNAEIVRAAGLDSKNTVGCSQIDVFHVSSLLDKFLSGKNLSSGYRDFIFY